MEIEKENIILCQAGYHPDGCKYAVLTRAAARFEVRDSAGQVCFAGEIQPFGPDENSGDEVFLADFSGLNREGEYTLWVKVCGAGMADADIPQKQAAEKDDLSDREIFGVDEAKNSTAQWISSRPFSVREDVYAPVLYDTAKAFYYLRCGCELPARYAGKFGHPACHTGRAMLWEDNGRTAEAAGGWHDAGDYGRYVTAGACALAHLLFAYQLYPSVFDALRLDIPESGGALPDLLAECRYELEWLLKMQREDGAVYHKETTARHAPFIMPEEDTAQLYLLPVSSMATADFAAVCALAARIYRRFDADFADRLRTAALKTGGWLAEHPEFIGFENPPGCGTGGYGESGDEDNRFWAWIELYALTGNPDFHERAKRALDASFSLTALGYGSVGGFGALSYLLCAAGKAGMPERNKALPEQDEVLAEQNRRPAEAGQDRSLPETEQDRARLEAERDRSPAEAEQNQRRPETAWDEALARRFREEFLTEAERLAGLSDGCGYGAAMAARDYGWGSNMNLMKHGMIFAIAETVCGWEHPGKEEFRTVQRGAAGACGAGYPQSAAGSPAGYAERQIQCLLGLNALGFSYVSGTGENSLKNPHLRPAYADGVEECIPGMVSGGPNGHPADEMARRLIAPGTPPMKCFVDHVGCYSLNEITIYWNSPTVFVLAFLQNKYKH